MTATLALIAAAEALSNLLAAENAALESMNIPAAVALVPAKQAATNALVAAQSHPPDPGDPVLRATAERLRALAATNRTLLERALHAQNRVLGCIARAMPRALAQGGRYGACGANLAAQKLPPVALSARA